MFKGLILSVLISLPVVLYAQEGRSSIEEELTRMARESGGRVELSLDPNDDTTLIFYLESMWEPPEIADVWTEHLFPSRLEKLTEMGLDKVRIYTSQSLDSEDYVLKSLNDRSDIASELTQLAKSVNVPLEFSVDPNDDTTLVFIRESDQRPNELTGDWTIYLYFFGSNPDYLKKNGFKKVRIYTNQSQDVDDYVLKPL